MEKMFIIESRLNDCASSSYSPCDHSSAIGQARKYLEERGIDATNADVGDEFLDVDGRDYRIVEG